MTTTHGNGGASTAGIDVRVQPSKSKSSPTRSGNIYTFRGQRPRRMHVHPLVVVIILPATYCDPARFMSNTSSHVIVVVVGVRIIIVSVRVAVIVAAM